MSLPEIIGDFLIIALGIILAVHFILIWIFGGVFIYEHCRPILITETVMSVAIIPFGINRLLQDIRRKNGGR